MIPRIPPTWLIRNINSISEKMTTAASVWFLQNDPHGHSAASVASAPQQLTAGPVFACEFRLSDSGALSKLLTFCSAMIVPFI